MALAISPSSVEVRPSSRTRAISRTSLAALVASVATIPMVYALAVPLTQLMTSRGTGTGLDALAAVSVIVAPATYALFCALVFDLTKNKVAQPARKDILKVALFGALPYVLLATVGFATGIMAIKITAMLSVPVAIAATVWFSSTTD